jgi:carbon storage regulator
MDCEMLYLTRKVGESIIINDNIELTVVEVRGKTAKLGITFPPEATVLRKELHDRIKQENLAAALGDDDPLAVDPPAGSENSDPETSDPAKSDPETSDQE